jgi:hypothetical protein
VVADLGAYYGIGVSSSGGGCAPPDAPSGLTATADGHQAVDLTWVDGSTDEDGFRVERREGQAGSWAEVVRTAAEATSYADAGLSAETEYCYRVSAFNGDGYSDFSNEACATTGAAPPAPPPVDVPGAGLRLRLVANDLGGVLADGGEVSSWSNRGSEADAVQANAGKRPTFYAGDPSGFNGQAFVGFNEGGDNDELLEVAGVTGHGSGTLVAVFRQEDATSHNYGIFATYGSSSTRAAFHTRRSAGTYPISYWDPNNLWKDAGTSVAAGAEHVVVWRLSAGDTFDHLVDGARRGDAEPLRPVSGGRGRARDRRPLRRPGRRAAVLRSRAVRLRGRTGRHRPRGSVRCYRVRDGRRL